MRKHPGQIDPTTRNSANTYPGPSIPSHPDCLRSAFRLREANVLVNTAACRPPASPCAVANHCNDSWERSAVPVGDLSGAQPGAGGAVARPARATCLLSFLDLSALGSTCQVDCMPNDFPDFS